MSKKHYRALAKALGESADVDEATMNVIHVLAQENPRFRAGTFWDAVVDARAAKFGVQR